jgi:hypothetical protein
MQRTRGFDSFDDWPWPLLYKQLAESYPSAKFILTVCKDPETWFDSSFKFRDNFGPSSLRKLIYGFEKPTEKNKKQHLDYYSSHINNVRKYFLNQPDRLHEVCWENTNDWKELCNFLNIQKIPNLPIPRANQIKLHLK